MEKQAETVKLNDIIHLSCDNPSKIRGGSVRGILYRTPEVGSPLTILAEPYEESIGVRILRTSFIKNIKEDSLLGKVIITTESGTVYTLLKLKSASDKMDEVLLN